MLGVMSTRSLAALLVVVTSTVLVACAGGGTTGPAAAPFTAPVATATPTPTPTPAPTPPPPPTPLLMVTPSSVFFDLGQQVPAAQSVVLSGSALMSGAPLTVSIADPTVVGVTQVQFVVAGPPTYAINPVAHGSTTVTFTIGTASAAVTATTATCGRPDFLRPESQLIFPQPGSTGVPTSLSKLYFAVGYPSFNSLPSAIHLNLIVGQHATQPISVTLQADTAPPGSATPAPAQNVTYQVMSVPVPLMPATAYRTQLYDDTCEPAILTGAFTTV
jgi:hypothetical protein